MLSCFQRGDETPLQIYFFLIRKLGLTHERGLKANVFVSVTRVDMERCTGTVATDIGL
jgi:hypothetical protein